LAQDWHAGRGPLRCFRYWCGVAAMGGTGLEPVTPSLSIRSGRSHLFAEVRLERMVERKQLASEHLSERERTSSVAIVATRSQRGRRRRRFERCEGRRCGAVGGLGAKPVVPAERVCCQACEVASITGREHVDVVVGQFESSDHEPRGTGPPMASSGGRSDRS